MNRTLRRAPTEPYTARGPTRTWVFFFNKPVKATKQIWQSYYYGFIFGYFLIKKHLKYVSRPIPSQQASKGFFI